MSIGWKIAFVTVLSVSVATIAAFVYGVLVFFGAFAPALPPMPDWKTPYEAALAEGDCATAVGVLKDAYGPYVIEPLLIGVDLLDHPACQGDDFSLERDILSFWRKSADDARARFEAYGEVDTSSRSRIVRLNRRDLRELLSSDAFGFSFWTAPVLSTQWFALNVFCINPIKVSGVRERDQLRRALAERATGEKPPPSDVVSRLGRCADKAGRLAAAFKTRARTDDQRRFAFEIYTVALANGAGAEVSHQRAMWMLGGLRGDPDHSLSGVPPSHYSEERAFQELYQTALTGYAPALRDLLAYIDYFPPGRLELIDLQICITYGSLARLMRSGDRPDLEAYTDGLKSWLIRMRGDLSPARCELYD